MAVPSIENQIYLSRSSRFFTDWLHWLILLLLWAVNNKLIKPGDIDFLEQSICPGFVQAFCPALVNISFPQTALFAFHGFCDLFLKVHHLLPLRYSAFNFTVLPPSTTLLGCCKRPPRKITREGEAARAAELQFQALKRTLATFSFKLFAINCAISLPLSIFTALRARRTGSWLSTMRRCVATFTIRVPRARPTGVVPLRAATPPTLQYAPYHNNTAPSTRHTHGGISAEDLTNCTQAYQTSFYFCHSKSVTFLVHLHSHNQVHGMITSTYLHWKSPLLI